MNTRIKVYEDGKEKNDLFLASTKRATKVNYFSKGTNRVLIHRLSNMIESVISLTKANHKQASLKELDRIKKTLLARLVEIESHIDINVKENSQQKVTNDIEEANYLLSYDEKY